MLLSLDGTTFQPYKWNPLFPNQLGEVRGLNCLPAVLWKSRLLSEILQLVQWSSEPLIHRCCWQLWQHERYVLLACNSEISTAWKPSAFEAQRGHYLWESKPCFGNRRSCDSHLELFLGATNYCYQSPRWKWEASPLKFKEIRMITTPSKWFPAQIIIFSLGKYWFANEYDRDWSRHISAPPCAFICFLTRLVN